ncbi:MAG: hypothetical protein ACTHLW_12555, partial [Verrucomicrobiota bacterium]
VELKSQAADRVVALILGWSEKELGNEPLYTNLHRFLDTDFRRDVKNLGLYGWLGSVSTSSKAESNEEFMVRFIQYLVERNYIHLKDAPILFSINSGKEDAALASLLQRFLAGKLAVANQTNVPAALNFVADPQALQRSWTGYLAGTDSYRAKLQQWEKQKELDPNLAKPEPSEVFDDCLGPLLDFSSVGETDHLTVKLALPIAPTHSNGKWNAARKQVLWTSNLETRNGTNYLPVLCYAGWSQPSEAFQKEHLGRVALTGDHLLQYNFWRVTLNQQQAEEWESMLKKSTSGADLQGALPTFRFADESQTRETSALGRELLATVLDEKPGGEDH